MQKTSRFSRLLTLVTAVALAVCLPVSAYAETETTEEAAAPAVVEEAAQDNTADEAASEDSASSVRVVDVTIFMDTTKGHFESDPDNVALTYLNRAEFEETPITLPTVIANEGWELVLTVDGFLVSPNVEVTGSEVLDTGFAYSDHNPIIMTVKLRDAA